MKTSELIKELLESLEENGDLPVVFQNRIFASSVIGVSPDETSDLDFVSLTDKNLVGDSDKVIKIF